MNFKVGPTAYKVRMARDLRDEDGRPAAGLCEWSSGTIWISMDIPPRKRRKVLFHELRHAWQNEFGRPMDDEGDADQASSFTEDAWTQLDRQGGVKALERLTLDGVVDRSDDTEAPADPRAAQCPQCSGLLNFPIRTETPDYDTRHARMAATRSADCDFCGHTVSWREAVTAAGVPTGHILQQPIIDRGPRPQIAVCACQ